MCLGWAGVIEDAFRLFSKIKVKILNLLFYFWSFQDNQVHSIFDLLNVFLHSMNLHISFEMLKEISTVPRYSTNTMQSKRILIKRGDKSFTEKFGLLHCISE